MKKGEVMRKVSGKMDIRDRETEIRAGEDRRQWSFGEIPIQAWWSCGKESG